MSDNKITIEMIDGSLSNSLEVIVTDSSSQVIEVNPQENIIEVTVDSTNLVFSSGVSSWNGRTLDVLPEYGDYSSDLIENVSGVDGISLSDALNTINGQLLNPENFINQFTTDAQQVSGRLSILSPSITEVSDAVNVQFLLDNVVFQGDIPSDSVTSVFGRDGDVLAELGDYSSDLIENVSGVGGDSLSDALDIINSQLLNPDNFVNQFTTDAQQVTGRLSVQTPTLINSLDAVNVQFLSDNVVFTNSLDAINVSTFINDANYITLGDLPTIPVISVNGKDGIVVLDKSDIGLPNVDNTSDVNKPISEATEIALSGKLASGDNISELVNDISYITIADVPVAPVTSVNNQTGVVTLTKASIGLSNVENTSDADKPISNAVQSSLDDKLESGDAISELDNDAGYITAGDLPSGGLTYKGTWDADQNIPDLSSLSPSNGDFYEVSVAGNTNLNGESDWQIKDWAIYSDTLGWDKLDNTSDVTSVNTKTGAVVLDKSDIGLPNVDNTSDADKPISNLTQTALDSKLKSGDAISELDNDVGYITLGDVPESSVTSVNSKVGVVVLDKSDIGLTNVDNTSDANKPISTLTQSALDNKLESGDNVSELNNDAGYITVSEVPDVPVTSVASKTGDVVLDSSDVGLSNVNNTSDADKPISTLTQSALDDKIETVNVDGVTVTGDGVGTPLSAVSTTSGVTSVNGVSGDVQLRTVDGESLTDGTDDISIGVAAITGDGVTTVGGSAIVRFPDSDQVDSSTSVNKFVTQGEKDSIDSALQSGDSVSELDNDAGYITSADIPTSPVTSVNTKTGDVILDKSDIGLPNVDNTSDADKPISTLTQEQLNLKGDMFKSQYDSDDDGIVDRAESVVFKAQLNQSVVKGNLLYGVGRDLVTGNPVVGLADNTVSFADKTVGMALTDGASGTIIEVVKIGVIEGLDTSTFAVGETLYLSTFGTFKGKSQITTGIFNPIGYVVLSGFGNGSLIIDTTATESITSDNTINDSSVSGRTVTDALDALSTSSSGVQSVTGDGVSGTASDVVLEFPDKSDLGLANVDNTSDADKPVSTATQLALNTKLDKPNTEGFEGDLITRTATSGEFDTRTPNGGVYKLVDIIQGVSMTGNSTLDVQITSGESFSTSTFFPKNISNQFPNQNPFSDQQTFVGEIYDPATNRWLENPVIGQVHQWRITLSYTRGTTQANREVLIRLTNPDTGFSIFALNILPNGNQFSTSTRTYELTTIADSASVGSGYEMQIQTVGAPITINNFEVVRTSLERL